VVFGWEQERTASEGGPYRSGETRLLADISNLPAFFGAAALGLIRLDVLLPYFMGAVVLLTGLFAIRGEVLSARWQERILLLGPLFYAVPMGVFSGDHFGDAKAISEMVPSYIPGKLFWAYFVGIALLAAALSIVLKKQARLAATLLSLMLFLFVVLITAPAIVATPGDRIAWSLGLRDLSFSAGALAFAGTQTEEWKAKGRSMLATIGRVVIAVAVLYYGVEQLVYPAFVPGVPLEKTTPVWIPGHIAWSYVAGVVFLAAGASLLVNRHTRWAATVVGVMVLVLVVFVYLPMWGASLGDIGNGLNYFADTLAFSGAALLLAAAMPRETRAHV
jgi:uncharacterized membrane protein